MQPKSRSMPLRKVLCSEWQAKQRWVSFPSFLNNFLIMICTKIWPEMSFPLSLPSLDKYNLSLKKNLKNLPCLKSLSRSRTGIPPPGSSAPCWIQLCPAARFPAKSAATTRGSCRNVTCRVAARARPKSLREQVLTGQGDDAAEVVISANAVLWEQKIKWRLKMPATPKYLRHHRDRPFWETPRGLGACPVSV